MKKQPEKSDDMPQEPRVTSMLGVGLDATDGEVRLTHGPNFSLVGGSEETHAVMQETACKINEELAKRGKQLGDVSHEEFADVFHEVRENLGGGY